MRELDPTILLNQIKLTLDYFDTPATKGKPIGWQAKEDWEAALKSMEAAGVVNAGWNVGRLLHQRACRVR